MTYIEMDGLRNYQAAQSGFAGSAEEMNENAANFRGRKSAIKNENASLVQQFKSATDMNALKGMGEEAAVRALKNYGGKALGVLDKRAFGGKIGEDTGKVWKGLKDRALGDTRTAPNKNFNEGNAADEDGTEMVDFGDGGRGVKDFHKDYGEDYDEDAHLYADEGDEDFQQGKAGEDEMPTFKDGDNDELNNLTFDEDDGVQMMTRGRMPPSRPQQTQEDTGVEESKQEEPETSVGENEGTMVDMPKKSIGDEGEGDEGGDLAGDAAGDVAEEGADTAVSAGLETAGTVLDATGVGALIGVPLQIAGAVLEGGAVYEMGKSVVDWFETDILGDAPAAPQVSMPTKGKTLSQSGLTAAPIYDSSMDMPSTSASF